MLVCLGNSIETEGIIRFQVVFNPETGRSKGFGFVKFEDARDADDAIADADGKVSLGDFVQDRTSVGCIQSC